MNTRLLYTTRLLLPLLLLTGLFVPFGGRVGAQEPESLRLEVRAGYDGFYKTARAVPVQITIANDGPAIEGELQIQIGSQAVGDAVRYTAPVSLPTRSNKRVPLLVYVPRIVDQLNVQLVDGGGNVLKTAASNRLSLLAPADTLGGVVSPEPDAFGTLEGTRPDGSRTAVAYLTPDDLPEAAVALNALDILVIDDTDTTRLTPAQLTALDAWVSTGGQLVITGGPNWQQTTAAFTDLLPVAVSGTETVSDLPALAAAAGTPFRDPGPYLVAAGSLREGELLLHQDGLPLLAAVARGQGRVIFLALDPKLAPLVDWDGTAVVWTAVVDGIRSRPGWANGIQDLYAAHESVASLPSISLPSVLTLVGFLLFYVLIVGPINYLILKRRNRPELAWVTIPVLVLIFAGLSYLFGFQIKGNESILNQIVVYVGQVGSPYARVNRVLGLYSPGRETYRLGLPLADAARPGNDAFGTRSSNFDAIERGSDVAFTNIRMDVAQIESFVADTVGALPQLSATAAIAVDSGGIQIDITLQNDSATPLSDLSLLAGDVAYELPDLPPGARVNERIPLTTLTGTSTLAGPRLIAFAPLSTNASTLLRSGDFFAESETYSRWQILQALENASVGATSLSPDRSDVLTLIAWTTQDPDDVTVNQPVNAAGMALYLLDLPLTSAITTGAALNVPVSLLNWEVVEADGVFEPTIYDVYLNGGRMDVAFRPWSQLGGLTVDSLAIVVEPGAYPAELLFPQVWLWDWETETWAMLEGADWGTTAVANPARFIGEDNSVRIRLIDQSQFGIGIGRVYPQFSGSIGR